MNLLVGFVAMTGLVFLLLVIAVVPRLAAHKALRRLHPLRSSTPDESQHAPGDTRWAEFLEHWSRACTAGSSLHSGFLHSLQGFPDLEVVLADVSLGLRRGNTLVDIDTSYLPSHWRRLLHLVGRTHRIAPLAREAERLRRAESERLEIAAQFAALHTSISMLVWAPIYVSGFVLVIGSSARSFMLGSPLGLTILATGVALQVVGRMWVARLLAPASDEHDSEVIVDIASSLEAGFTIHQALTIVAPEYDMAPRAASTVELLDDLRQRFPHLEPAFDLLASSTQHGLPLADRLSEYVSTLRSRRTEESRAHIRRMSVKANVPLVVCILPSFLLLTFTPIVATIITPLGSVG